MAGLDPAILLDARIKSSDDELKREDEAKNPDILPVFSCLRFAAR
jgi:hypothetical protein